MPRARVTTGPIKIATSMIATATKPSTSLSRITAANPTKTAMREPVVSLMAFSTRADGRRRSGAALDPVN